jgi:hypothetical protein
MHTVETSVGSILTRTTGYLKTVASHSLQPYRGCPFGRTLCGVGCYVRHNIHVTQGRDWGSFLEVRRNAAESYISLYARERAWAARSQFFSRVPRNPFRRKSGDWESPAACSAQCSSGPPMF